MPKQGLCDFFPKIEDQPHFVVTPATMVEFINNLHISLNSYINQSEKAQILAMLETSEPTFNIIHQCILSSTPTLSEEEKNLLINLSRAIIYDTEHDFGSGSSRANCKNDIIKKCLSSIVKLRQYNNGVDLPNLNTYAKGFFAKKDRPLWSRNVITFNDCSDDNNINKDAIKNLSDIKYYLQDSAVHKEAKTAFLMSGGKTIYRAVSTAIDPAGCKNEKTNEYNVADHINIKYELLMLNISLIFYQNFYTIFHHLKKCFFIELITDRNGFKIDKRFNINIISFSDQSKSQIANVIGGSNCSYSPQKICSILTSSKSAMEKILMKNYYGITLSTPQDYLFARALQLILKGHGDFGQIFWSMYLYYTPNDKLPGDFYQDIDENFQKFYNNCLIQTGDKYFACISAILKAPVLIGTTGNISMYIIDSNKKYYGQNILMSYNLYSDLKLYNDQSEAERSFMTKKVSIQESQENIFESIINENAYNKYYNDNIIHFFIFNNENGSFTLCECNIDKSNNQAVILYNITDLSFWNLHPIGIDAYINIRDVYDSSNKANFDIQRSIVKNTTYHDLVNIKMFSWYSNDFISNNLPIITSEAEDIILKLALEKEAGANSEYGDIYGKTIDYIYFIIEHGLEQWRKLRRGIFKKEGTSFPERIRSITANNKTFEKINNNLKILIKFSDIIQNLLNVMYQNLNLLNNHFTRIYHESQNAGNYNNSENILKYSINIIEVYIEILKSDKLRYWIQIINQYSNENKNKFPFKTKFTDNPDQNNDIFKQEMVDFNSKIENIDTQDEIIISNFVKDFGNNISILSSLCSLISILLEKLHNLSSEKHTELIALLSSYPVPPESPLSRTQSEAIQFLTETEKQLPRTQSSSADLKVAEQTYSQSLDTIYEITNTDEEVCLEYCQDNECIINTTRDMHIFLNKYLDDILSEYEKLNHDLQTHSAKLTQSAQFQLQNIVPNMHLAYYEIYERLQLIYFYKDIYNNLDDKIINYIYGIWEHIAKQHLDNLILLKDYKNPETIDDNQMAYWILNIFEHDLIKQNPPENIPIIIKNLIKEMIYLEFKKTYNDNHDDVDAHRLILHPRENINDTTFDAVNWPSSLAGGSLYGISKKNSNKLKIYFKNIENIAEKIKLLKKNKIKNKDKIRQENNNIKKLKLKIKNECKKEKEKQRKIKEKEKQRRLKEKEKQKKQNEKNREKEKQKKQKEIEKEKQKKEINKEKEKQKKQKEKQKKEIEKEKQRKQKIIQKEKQKKEMEIEKQRKEKEKTKEKTKRKTKEKTKQKETLKTKKETKKLNIKIIKNI